VIVSIAKDTQNLVVVFRVRDERLYEFLSQPMVGSSGYLHIESESDSFEACFSIVRLGSP
jgi:hypothetical protein